MWVSVFYLGVSIQVEDYKNMSSWDLLRLNCQTKFDEIERDPDNLL